MQIVRTCAEFKGVPVTENLKSNLKTLLHFVARRRRKNSFLHLKNMISFMKTDVFTTKIRKFSACGGFFLPTL
jgi:hypothetical protein